MAEEFNEESDLQVESGDQKKKVLASVSEKQEKGSLQKFHVKESNMEAYKQRQQENANFLKNSAEDDQAKEADAEENSSDTTSANGCRPWVGAMKAPTWYKKDASLGNTPNVKIQLDHAHGYRSKDCRNNVHYLRSGHLVYNAAGVGVVMDIETRAQRFFSEHSDDVTAIAVSADQKLVATGQHNDRTKNCPVYIWRADTLEIVHKIDNGATKGCVSLAFSPSGNQLATISYNTDHDIKIIDVTTGKIVVDKNGGSDQLLACSWIDEDNLATVGDKHVRVWSTKSADFSSKRGIWGKNKCSSSIVSIAVNPKNNDILVGAVDGTVQVFKTNICSKVVQAHPGKVVDALNFSEGLLLSGARDNKVALIDPDHAYKVVERIDISKIFKGSMNSKVRSIEFTAGRDSLIVSTFGSEVYQVKLTKLGANTFSIAAYRQILSGHYSPNTTWTNEVWGLDLLRTNSDQYVTVSDDATIRVWSVAQKRQLRAGRLNYDSKGKKDAVDTKNSNDFKDNSKARAVAAAPDGNFLVGFKDGSLKLVNEALEVTKVLKDAAEWISVVRFSPKGDRVAAGSHDNIVYVYSYPEMKLVQKLNKHASFITHFDFSESGEFLRSICGAYELLFWDVNKGTQLTGGATQLRDDQWASHSCIFAWPVQKMWKKSYNDYTDINCVDRSNSKINGSYLLANGDDYSTVNVFRWPCVNANAKCIEAKGHCSFVTQIRFTADDKHIITTGGEDATVCVWKVSTA